MSKRRNLRRALLLGAFLFAIVLAIVFGLATLQVHATSDEIARSLPGDTFISHPLGAVNHAITIHRPPSEVWPWLAQMGLGRGGWYTYDFIDNRGCHSADRVLPAFQEIHVGSVFPAVPGGKDVFVVAAVESRRNLVLAWRQPDGTYQTTWAFVLVESAPGSTRLNSSSKSVNMSNPRIEELTPKTSNGSGLGPLVARFTARTLPLSTHLPPSHECGNLR